MVSLPVPARALPGKNLVVSDEGRIIGGVAGTIMVGKSQFRYVVASLSAARNFFPVFERPLW